MGAQKKVKNAFEAGFENRCIKLLVVAYKAIVDEGVLFDWHENDVTAQLHEHIESNQTGINWSIVSNVEHHLSQKANDKKKGFVVKYPRIDLRFVTIKS